MISTLINRVCKYLDEKQIAYMISGSIAMNLYAVPRLTRDVDIVIELESGEVDDFLALFENTYFSKESVFLEVERKGMFNIIDFETGFKVDFILRKETEYGRVAFQRRKIIDEFDAKVYVISIEDLIIAKLIWIQQLQSEKQLDDIRNLLENPEIDKEYLMGWIKKLKINTYSIL
jgi:hypothetical protein